MIKIWNFGFIGPLNFQKAGSCADSDWLFQMTFTLLCDLNSIDQMYEHIL